MTIIRHFTFDEPRISHLVVDEDESFVWLAFEQDSDGICHLKKVSAHDFDQVYFDIEIEVDVIVDVKLPGNGYIYVVYKQPNTYIFTRYSTSNPFTTYTNYSKPYGIPTPLEIANFSSDDSTFVLLPDHSGGYQARILHYSFGGTYLEVINISDLLHSSETLNDITSMTSDVDDNLWLVTYTNPVKLARIWFASGGWNMKIKSIQ